MPVINVTDADDVRLAPFRSLTDASLRRLSDAEHGTYIAESFPVIERALAAGHTVHAVLIAPRWRERALAVVGESATIFVAEASVLEAITGFDVHRGALAVFRRPQPLAVSDLLTGGTLVVIDGITDATNVGAIFRNAAALGASGVIVMAGSGDPLYRRSIRVSMGTVFQVPWAYADDWPALAEGLHGAGYTMTALALSDDAVAAEDFHPSGPVALIMGAEGPGLGQAALAVADTVLMIPMDAGVDSLNVAAASAIALYAVRAQRTHPVSR